MGKEETDHKKVLAVLRRYITSQNVVSREEVALVKSSYGFKLKQYAPRLLDKVPHKAAGINDLVLGRAVLPMPEFPTEKNMRQIRAAEKLIGRKRRQYEVQNQQFADMKPDTRLTEYLDRMTFVNKDGDVCEFTALQKHDQNLVLQKRYALLNWQQGLEKTAAVYHRAKYLLKYRKIRNVIILAPAIATNMTWIPFLSMNREQFRVVRSNADLETVSEGVFLVPLHLHARQAGSAGWQGLSGAPQEAVPRLRRVGRDNHPVVTAYKAYSQPLPPSQVQDT